MKIIAWPWAVPTAGLLKDDVSLLHSPSYFCPWAFSAAFRLCLPCRCERPLGCCVDNVSDTHFLLRMEALERLCTSSATFLPWQAVHSECVLRAESAVLGRGLFKHMSEQPLIHMHVDE